MRSASLRQVSDLDPRNEDRRGSPKIAFVSRVYYRVSAALEEKTVSCARLAGLGKSGSRPSRQRIPHPHPRAPAVAATPTVLEWLSVTGMG